MKSTLYRNGTNIAEGEDGLDASRNYEVPSGEATYALNTSMKRSAEVAAVSSRSDASWTFKSKMTSSATMMPISMARFGAPLDLSSRGKAGKNVTVQGAAAGGNLKSPSVYVSYVGKAWKKLTVKNGKVKYKNPAAGKSISLKVKIADKKDNVYYGH